LRGHLPILTEIFAADMAIELVESNVPMPCFVEEAKLLPKCKNTVHEIEGRVISIGDKP
jgi:hypothetical protein